jgi:hypothetical protein
MVQRHSTVASLGTRLSKTLVTPDPHPIVKLAAEGQAQFSLMLTRRSDTLRKAMTEYTHR